mgnify:CR=1
QAVQQSVQSGLGQPQLVPQLVQSEQQ